MKAYFVENDFIHFVYYAEWNGFLIKKLVLWMIKAIFVIFSKLFSLCLFYMNERISVDYFNEQEEIKL